MSILQSDPKGVMKSSAKQTPVFIGLLSLLLSTAAHSQETADDGPIVLAPIVVQGEKIGRSVDEVPPSIFVLDEDEIDRPGSRSVISTINAIGNVVSEEGIQLPSIRGIDGSAGREQSISAGAQPRVPILIDDVARPLINSAAVSRSSTWDVASVEVAKGPQASSTGRNALGGAIRVYTNDPSFDFEGALRGEGFTADGTFAGAGMVNIPVIEDQVAVRFTAEGSKGETFVDVLDPTNFSFDPEEEVFERYRGKLLITPEPIEGLEILLSADRIESEGPLPGFIDSDADDATVSDFGNTNAYEINEQTAYAGRVRYAFSDNFELTIRGSHIENDNLSPDTFLGLGNLSFLNDETEFESYLRFSSSDFLQSGVIGFIRNQADEDGDNDAPVFRFATDGKVVNTGAYGELELDVAQLGAPDGLAIILGGRYERDERSRTVSAGATFIDSDLEESRFLPKLGLRYTPNDNWAFGYTYSEGFRPGGVDIDLSALIFSFPAVAIAPFEPETISQHEIYTRASLLDGRLDLGASAFYYKYEDAQVPGASDVPVAQPGAPNLFGNVPEAVGMGIELDATADLGSGFTLFSSLGYLNTEITDAGAALAAFDGSDLPRAPEFTGSIGLLYEHELGFHARADARYVGDQFSGLGEVEIDSYAVLDFAGGYRFETNYADIELDAFVQNVTDERYFTYRIDVGTPLVEQSIGRPRTFGARVTMRF